ncbi:glycoside hydrolase family 16 protein [Desarmillaria ectypa]|nr:glycoside hydrolase family 16 protein [Desarmillaria ectypa]
MYSLLFAALFVSAQAHPAWFTLQDRFIGSDFFSGFDWKTFDDPTHGRVNYIDKHTAIATNLSYADNSKFFMRADAHNVVSASDSRGRDSVRIESFSAYDQSVVILDVEHMPAGCATWPAFWSFSQSSPWPQGGEIDIIEGVNLNTNNLASLHTTPNCTMPEERLQSGQTQSTNCDTNINYNQGCGSSFTQRGSYGSSLNSIGGGWYAMRRTKETGIQVWFWPRNSWRVPIEVRYPFIFKHIGFGTEGWGEPDATFPVKDCDYSTHFDSHKIVINLTFCGDWAGNVFASSGCGNSTCVNFVDNNPDKFKEAYWEINSLYVFKRV